MRFKTSFRYNFPGKAMRGKTVLLFTKNGFPPQFDFLSACQKTMFLTRSMQDEGFILHGKAAEMIFLRFAPKNRPAPPAKPVDTMKNEGLAALHCILLYV